MNAVPLRIMTKEFELIAEVDGYSSLQITRSWHSLGKMEIVVNRHVLGANELTSGRIVFPGAQTHKGYIIKDREIELTEDGKESEDWKITAVDLGHLLTQRITIPPDPNKPTHDIRDVGPVAMRQYVKFNASTPVDPTRAFPNFYEYVNPAHYSHLTPSFFSTRYDNLAEKIEEISIFCGVGWYVNINFDNNRFEFRAPLGRDLSVNQTSLPPVIFAPDLDTLGKMRYAESTIDHKNVAIVAGPGEGVDRVVTQTGEGEGYERYELFVDARDVPAEVGDPATPRPPQDIINDLIQRGEQKLSEHVQTYFADGQALTFGNVRYERDFDLGDIVTIRNRDWGISFDARITEVKEIYEGDGFKLELVFDNDQPTFIQKINKRFKDTSLETKK